MDLELKLSALNSKKAALQKSYKFYINIKRRIEISRSGLSKLYEVSTIRIGIRSGNTKV